MSDVGQVDERKFKKQVARKSIITQVGNYTMSK